MQKKYNDIRTNDKFGNWIVLDENDYIQMKGYRKYKCQCMCINKTVKYVDERNLKNGSSICCGNCTYKNIEVGDIFGEWTVIDNSKVKGKVLCQCSCGTKRMVNGSNLQKGLSTNCGCMQKNQHFKNNQHTEKGEEIIIGNKYNKWLVLEQVKSQSYLCECSCLYHTRKVLTRSQLLGDKNKGCKNCRLMQNLVGEVFGYLTVIGLDEEKTAKKHMTYWRCKCKCGNEITYSQEVLHKGRAISCGCKKSEFNLDLTGQRFGYLTVTKLLGRKYINNTTDSVIEWECKCDCGKTKIVRQNNLLFGNVHSCGCMNRSYGELLIYNYLKKYDFDFVEQYRINNCRNILPLPFDFALFSNSKLVGLIEFDGKQHFKPSKFNKCSEEQAIENYMVCVKRDGIKTEYCKNNNIKLLRITYEDLGTGDWIYFLWDFLYKLKLIVDNVA